MKKNYVFIIIIASFFINSCTCNKHTLLGAHISGCYAYGIPEKIIYLNDDSTHITLQLCFRGMYVEGIWRIKSDTLFVTDEYHVTRKSEKIKIDSTSTTATYETKYSLQKKRLDPAELVIYLNFTYLIRNNELLDITRIEDSITCQFRKLKKATKNDLLKIVDMADD